MNTQDDNSNNKSQDTDESLARELIDALDKAIKNGPWETGLVFQNIGKQLKSLREQCVTHLNVNVPQAHGSHKRAPRPAEQNGDHTTVYISLYMSQGSDIQKWEKLLRNIQNQIATRPIYKNEDDLRTLLRSKADKTNEAYISIIIKNQHIMPQTASTIPTDKLGHELLILKPGALDPANIVDFMHKSGHYTFENNHLVRLGDQEYLDFL